MGCASSKQARCRHCQSPYSPLARSYTVHHPAQHEGDSYHVVALTSTSLDSLKVESSNQKLHHRHFSFNGHDHEDDEDYVYINKSSVINEEVVKNQELSLAEEINRAKTWSQMISEKIPKVLPKTPTRTPPGEPETINTWELMEGLEDCSPLHLPNQVGRSFSFHTIPDSSISITSPPKQKLQENDMEMNENGSDSKSNSSTTISDFDPDIISTFRKALEELSPRNSFHLGQLQENEKLLSPRIQPLFSEEEFLDLKEEKVNGVMKEATKCPPGGEEKVVIYFTSLRGVRRTYEDCCHVRVILKGFGVQVDERDMSMDSGFREELKELLGDEFRGGGLPKVFVNGSYIGGAEEVRQLHEDGELQKILEKCEKEEDGSGICEACGDIRFVPCERCSGSCKIYYEDEEDDEEEESNLEGEEEEMGEFGFQRCPDCNENGLIRCPVCCCS